MSTGFWHYCEEVDGRNASKPKSVNVHELFGVETSTPATVVNALIRAVRTRGADALKEPDNVERLSRCTQAARAHLDAFIKRMEAGR